MKKEILILLLFCISSCKRVPVSLKFIDRYYSVMYHPATLEYENFESPLLSLGTIDSIGGQYKCIKLDTQLEEVLFRLAPLPINKLKISNCYLVRTAQINDSITSTLISVKISETKGQEQSWNLPDSSNYLLFKKNRQYKSIIKVNSLYNDSYKMLKTFSDTLYMVKSYSGGFDNKKPCFELSSMIMFKLNDEAEIEFISQGQAEKLLENKYTFIDSTLLVPF